MLQVIRLQKNTTWEKILRFSLKIRLIDRYLFRQVLSTTLVGMILFVVIWVSPEILFKIIKKIISHEYTLIYGLKIFLLEIPMVLGKAIPMGLLLGCLWVFDSMSKNFELITMRSVGVSFKRLLIPILLISVIFGCVSFVTYDKLIPYSRKILDAKKGVVAQQFVYVDKDEKGKPNQVVMISNYDKISIKNVNVLQFSTQNDADVPLLKNIYTSPYAIYSDKKLILQNGVRYGLSEDNIFKEIKPFDNVIALKPPKAEALMELMDFSMQRARNFTNAELYKYIKILEQEGMQEEYNYNLNKYYQRFFDSISCVFLAILGCILGYARPRAIRLFGFTAAVGVIFAYYIIIPLIDLLAQKGVLLPIIAAGVPCGIVILAIFLSLYFKNLDIVK